VTELQPGKSVAGLPTAATVRLIANARMYSSIAPGAADAWRQLLKYVAAASGVDLDIIDHAYPASLPDLWARPDLGCALMCGWPMAREERARPLIAAPIPAAEWSAGRAIYRAEFVVRIDSPFAGIEDTFGHHLAFNALDSHSGYNMPRGHLALWADRQPLYRALVGPTGSHLRSIEAVLSGEADVAAVDSYYLALAHRHVPHLVAGLRVIDVTPASPIPPFVGSAALTAIERDRLERALLGFGAADAERALLAVLCLSGFAPANRQSYDATVALERDAAHAGYREIR
jgi:ABC-type phosphate/phosphonate transport system substrate-binding protein